jgi:CRISPR-associated protein Csd1
LAYVLALNALLRSGDTINSRQGRRTDVAGIGFLTWLRKADDFDAFELLERPDPDKVAALLRFRPNTIEDPNRFYMVGVSGNGARLRVRYWLTDSLDHIRLNLQGWHQQVRVFYPWEDARPVAFWQLLYAIHREGQPPAHDVLTLLRRGIEGRSQPLGYSILSACLTRLRHPADKLADRKDYEDDSLSPARLRVPMGLIRMCINDIRSSKGEPEMSEGLDLTCAEPAYVCGRLMAEFENLQREANRSALRSEDGGGRDVNSSVLDRYFALASTYPAVAFPKLEVLAQKHLRKLRRDKPGTAVAIDSRIQRLHNLLSPAPGQGFTSRLSLDGQGLFMLGYYHQKAWSIAQAKARAEANSPAAGTNNNEEN